LVDRRIYLKVKELRKDECGSTVLIVMSNVRLSFVIQKFNDD